MAEGIEITEESLFVFMRVSLMRNGRIRPMDPAFLRWIGFSGG
jgi:hypothetical protein